MEDSVISVLIRYVLAPLLRVVYRPEVHGLENLPSEGPVILASNHRAALDTGVITVVVGRRVRFLGKAEYFTGKGLKGRMLAAFLDSLGYVPVERKKARSSLAALDVGRQILENGEVFALYPEGTRSRDGRLHRGRTGVASLALTTGVTVIPVALVGTENLQPNGKGIPRLAKIKIVFGKPLNFCRYEHLESSPTVRRAVTDEIMYAIMELSGLEYVDRYHRLPDQQ
jgi:1-acyl-sn-glycerol-3-phosphate acyltransferase